MWGKDFVTEEEIKRQLEAEGFKDIYVWQDAAGYEYPEHTHEKLTAHVILEGGMELNSLGAVKILKTGERYDVPASTTHTAKMGMSGCKYVVGEK